MFFGVPHLATCIFLFFYNEPELGVGIDPGMAWTPLPSSIGQGLNPQPSDREPSARPLDHCFCYPSNVFAEVSPAEVSPRFTNIYIVFSQNSGLLWCQSNANTI